MEGIVENEESKNVSGVEDSTDSGWNNVNIAANITGRWNNASVTQNRTELGGESRSTGGSSVSIGWNNTRVPGNSTNVGWDSLGVEWNNISVMGNSTETGDVLGVEETTLSVTWNSVSAEESSLGVGWYNASGVWNNMSVDWNTTSITERSPDTGDNLSIIEGDIGIGRTGIDVNGIDEDYRVLEEEAGVLSLLRVSYGMVVPVVVATGLLINTIGLYLLTRPPMRIRPANTYLVVLVGCDVLTLLATIPTVLTLNGCHLSSYNAALYLAHASFTAFYILQTFTLYLILWISYDRFLALWWWEHFRRAQGKGVVYLRLALTLFLCVGIHLRHLLDVDVVCWRQGKIFGAWEEAERGCVGGRWLIWDGLHREGREQTWQETVWWVLRGVVVLAVPVILVLVFNASIVVGMVTRRLQNAAATSASRRHALSSIYITLAVSGTFLACTLPIALHALLYASNIHHCHGPYPEEVFRAVANILLLVEHLTHVPVLAFNLTFRVQAIQLLTSIRTLTTSSFLSGIHFLGAGNPPADQNEPKPVPQAIPSICIVPPPEDTEESVAVGESYESRDNHNPLKNLQQATDYDDKLSDGRELSDIQGGLSEWQKGTRYEETEVKTQNGWQSGTGEENGTDFKNVWLCRENGAGEGEENDTVIQSASNGKRESGDGDNDTKKRCLGNGRSEKGGRKENEQNDTKDPAVNNGLSGRSGAREGEENGNMIHHDSNGQNEQRGTRNGKDCSRSQGREEKSTSRKGKDNTMAEEPKRTSRKCKANTTTQEDIERGRGGKCSLSVHRSVDPPSRTSSFTLEEDF